MSKSEIGYKKLVANYIVDDQDLQKMTGPETRKFTEGIKQVLARELAQKIVEDTDTWRARHDYNSRRTIFSVEIFVEDPGYPF